MALATWHVSLCVDLKVKFLFMLRFLILAMFIYKVIEGLPVAYLLESSDDDASHRVTYVNSTNSNDEPMSVTTICPPLTQWVILLDTRKCSIDCCYISVTSYYTILIKWKTHKIEYTLSAPTTYSFQHKFPAITWSAVSDFWRRHVFHAISE